MLGHDFHVLDVVALGEKSSVNHRMESFDSSVEHFGKASEVAHFPDRESRGAKRFRGAAGGDEIPSECREALREFDETGLV